MFQKLYTRKWNFQHCDFKITCLVMFYREKFKWVSATYKEEGGETMNHYHRILTCKLQMMWQWFLFLIGLSFVSILAWSARKRRLKCTLFKLLLFLITEGASLTFLKQRQRQQLPFLQTQKMPMNYNLKFQNILVMNANPLKQY